MNKSLMEMEDIALASCFVVLVLKWPYLSAGVRILPFNSSFHFDFCFPIMAIFTWF